MKKPPPPVTLTERELRVTLDTLICRAADIKIVDREDALTSTALHSAVRKLQAAVAS